MFRRDMEVPLRAAAAKMPVVTITGPRQSGKTTLARHAFPSHAYVSLEAPDELDRARSDPRGFLARVRDGAVIDEVHRLPDLLSYLQGEVDADQRPGRFVLTASQNLLLMRQVTQTLAGRTAIARLLPLSLAEISGWGARDPLLLGEPRPDEGPPPRGLWPSLFAGFYPRVHAGGLDPTRWFSDYFATYVERDVHEVLRIGDLVAFREFVRLLAARTAQELNLKSLADDVGISAPTARSWLSVLVVGHVVDVVRPHHANYGKRVRRRPKLHFLDTGLVCYLLGIPDAVTLERHPLRGAVFESFVYAEIAKSFHNSLTEPRLFFWRDATGHEIDLVVDHGLDLVPLEAKSGATVRSDALDTLRWWMGLRGNPARRGVLVHGGDEVSVRAGVSVRPWYRI